MAKNRRGSRKRVSSRRNPTADQPAAAAEEEAYDENALISSNVIQPSTLSQIVGDGPSNDNGIEDTEDGNIISSMNQENVFKDMEQICGQHTFLFKDWKTRNQGRGILLDCEGVIFSKKHSAIRCSTSQEVQSYYTNCMNYGLKVFNPLIGLQQKDNGIILIGSYAGNTEGWINRIRSRSQNFWSVDNTEDWNCERLDRF